MHRSVLVLGAALFLTGCYVAPAGYYGQPVAPGYVQPAPVVAPAVTVGIPIVPCCVGWGYYAHPIYGYGYHPYAYRGAYRRR